MRVRLPSPVQIVYMFYVYALYSIRFNRLYIGHTSNIEKRLHEHNLGRVKSTKSFIPYKVFYFEEFETRFEAILREKELKGTKGRRFLKAEMIKFLKS